jgi:hypothetical protein
MNECQEHWDLMRKKIEELGLSHLTAVSGEDAADRAVKAIERGPGATTPDAEWDPLMAMSHNFFRRVGEVLGIAILAPDPATGKPRCPLCVVRGDFDAHNTPSGTCGKPSCMIRVKPGEVPWDLDWIESCGAAMKEYALERGLLKLQ